MFNPNKSSANDLNANIAMMEDLLASLEWDTPEYNDCLTKLERLHKLKAKAPQSPGVDPNTVIAAAANVAGILIIVGYERINIITTKALSLLIKPRLG